MIPPIHLRKTEIQAAEIFESETKSLTTKSLSVPNFTSKHLLSLPKIPKNISTGSLKNYGETQVDIHGLLESQYASTNDTFISTVCYAMLHAWLLCFATVLYGLYGVFIELSKRGKDTVPYNPAAMFFLVELAKFLVSCFLFLREVGFRKAFIIIQSLRLKDLILFAFPAFLYCGSNNLDVYLLRHMDPGSQQILAQTKVATTAICWWWVFRKPLSREQWSALLLLMVGSSSIAYPRGAASEHKMYVLPFGIVLLTIQITFSAAAGVYTEWVYKYVSDYETSIHLQNINMYIWGMIANFILLRSVEEPEHRSYLTHHFNPYTWIVLFIYTAKGLAAAQIMKFFSNIVKLLVNGAAMFISHFFTWYLFGLQSSWLHKVGLITVGGALVLYNSQQKDVQTYTLQYARSSVV